MPNWISALIGRIFTWGKRRNEEQERETNSDNYSRLRETTRRTSQSTVSVDPRDSYEETPRRGRGRPRKVPAATNVIPFPGDVSSLSDNHRPVSGARTESGIQKRGRGRPRKVTATGSSSFIPEFPNSSPTSPGNGDESVMQEVGGPGTRKRKIDEEDSNTPTMRKSIRLAEGKRFSMPSKPCNCGVD